MLTRARLLDLKIVEAGVRHRARASGVSKVSLRDIPRTLSHLLPFWWNIAFGGAATRIRLAGVPEDYDSFWGSDVWLDDDPAVLSKSDMAPAKERPKLVVTHTARESDRIE